MPFPYDSSGPMRECDRFLHRRGAERHERKHVKRPHPRMNAGMGAQIDHFERDAGDGNARVQRLFRCAGDGENAAMMDGVAGAVKDFGAAAFGRRSRFVDYSKIAPL